MNKVRSLFAGLVLAAAAGLLLAQDAQAYQVKRVIRGSMDLTTVEINSLDLTSPTNYLGGTLLDTSKTLVFATVRSNSDEPTVHDVFASLDDEQTVTFVRFNPIQANVEWMIVEFVTGVSVTSGLTTFGDCTTSACRSKTITLPQSLNLTKTLAFLSWRTYSDLSATTEDEYHTYAVDFTAANKMRIQRTDSAGNAFNDVYYQIAEFDEDVQIQSGTCSIATGSATYSTAVAYTAGTVAVTNGSKNITGDDAGGQNWTTMAGRMFEVGNSGVRYKLISVTDHTATIEPAYAGATLGGQSYEISEFLDVTTTKSILFMTSRGGNDIVGEDMLLWPDGQIADTDTLTFSRFEGGTTNDAAFISWFVLSFQDEGIVTRDSASQRFTFDPTTSASNRTLATSTQRERTINVNTVSINDTSNSSTIADDRRFTMTQTNDTTVAFQRGVSGLPVYVVFYAAEFPPVKVVTPNGTEGTWTVGSNQTINWYHSDDTTLGGSCGGTNRTVTIQGWANGAYRQIDNTTCVSADTMSWTVPFEIGTGNNPIGTAFTVKILAQEVSGDYYGRNFDISNGPITIVGALSNPTLSGAQPALVGDTGRTINWTQNGTLGDVKINLSTNNGTTWNDGTVTLANLGGLLATVTPAIGTSGNLTCTGTDMTSASCAYTWSPIPDLTTTTLRVRVLPVLTGTAGVITGSTNPNGTAIVFTTQGDHGLTAGETVRVTGITHPAISGGDTGNVQVATTPLTTTFTLTGVNGNNGAAGSGGTVSRGVNGTPLLSGTSASAYEIRPSLTVTSPATGNSYARGRTYTTATTPNTIKWTTTGTVSNVDIWLSYNTGSSYPTQLANGIGLCGTPPCYNFSGGVYSFDWTVSGTEQLTTSGKISVVSDNQNPLSSTIGDFAPNTTDVFSVISSLSMDAPLTTDPVMRVGVPTDIDWSVNGGPIGSLDIFYTTNWTGCQNINTQDAVGPPANCWTLVPGASSLNSGAGTFPWTVSDIVTNGVASDVGLRVEDTTSRTLIYDKDGAYTVKGTIGTVTVNNIAGTVRVGASPLIQWTKDGSMGNVRIALSKNSGSSYAAAFATNVAGTSYNGWTVLDTDMDEDAMIKVYLSEGESSPSTGIAGETGVFKIRGNITSATTDDTDYTVGTTAKILWTSTPSNWAENVQIYYKVGAGSYQAISGATPPASGQGGCTPAPCYNWPIPGTNPLGAYTVKVEHNSYTDTLDETDAFTVHGSITLEGEADSGGQSVIWKIGDQINIAWDKSGTIGNVTIKYSKNGGTDSYPYLITTVDAEVVSSYDWCVGYNDGCSGTTPGTDAHDPDLVIGTGDRNNQIKIKIEAVSDSVTQDITTNNFIIQKQFTDFAEPAPTLYVDDLADLTWTTKGRIAAGVNVVLSYDTASGSGGFTGLINNGDPWPDAGSFPDWSVPDVASALGQNTIVVRLASQNFPDDVLAETGTFRIRGKIDELVPTASNLVYNYNSPITISWRNHGTLGAMTIKLATDGSNFNTTLKALASTTPNATNTWVWNAANDPVNFPPPVGSTYKIKIEQDSDASNVFKPSDNNFRVKGVLALTTANTNGLWAGAGLNEDITWTKAPTNYADNQIRLYYSTSAAITDDLAGCQHASWVNIAPNPNTTTGSPASWEWTSIPAGAISNTFRLKIQDGLDCTQSFDISDATGAIVRGSLSNLQTLGTPWLIGTTNSISWSSTPAAQGDVLVEYTTDGTNYNPITPQGPATNPTASETGSLNWPIPQNVLGADYDADIRIRVKLVSDPDNVVTPPQSPFVIKKRYVSISVPAATLYVGDPNDITWDTQGNTGGANQVVLAYDTASGSGGYNATPLINAGAAMTDNELYPWTVADNIGIGRRIRVKSNAFPSDVFGDMTSDFTIRGKILLTQPTAASTLVVGNTYQILFEKRGSIGNVKIRYNRSGCATPIEITPGGGTTNATSFDWNVASADGCGNNIIDSNGTKNSNFLLVGATHEGKAIQTSSNTTPVVITSTAHGFTNSQSVTISGHSVSALNATWTVANAAANTFELNGSTAQGAGTGGTAYPGTGILEASFTTQNFQVKGDIYNSAPTDFAPNGGEVWAYGGAPQFVKWKARGDVGNVRIRLNKCADSHADCGGASENNYGIILSGPGSLNKTIVSSSNTTPVVMTSTAHGFNNSDSVTISGHSVSALNAVWTVANATANTFELSGSTAQGAGTGGTATKGSATHTGGESIPYNFVDDDCTGACSSGYTGVWEWNIPDQISAHAKVRVESTVTGNDATGGAMATYAVSQTNFRIRGNIVVTSPSSSLLLVGETTNIGWTPTGAIGPVNISLMFDNDGAPYANNISIASSYSGANPYPNYLIPASAAVSSYAVMRVTAVSDSLTTDDSAEFKIFVPVNAPVNSNEWVVGSQYAITWTAPTFDTPGFKIELSPDNGLSWPGTGDYLLAGSDTSGDGTFSWTIPSTTNLMTNEGVIRVSKATDANAKDISGGLFYIKGSISNVHVKTLVGDPPPGSPIDIPIGSNKQVTWAYTGALGTVNVTYATNADQGSPTWQAVSGCTGVSVGSNGTGSCAWNNVPSPASSKVKVKVENVPNAGWLTVSQASPNGATGAGTYNSIIGSIAMVDPDAVQRTMEVGGQYTIEWFPQGFALNHPFKIEYWYAASPGWVELTNPVTGTPGTVSGSNLTWAWPTPLGTGIPNTISNTVKFKVSDFNDPNKVNDPSTAENHIIKGTLSLVSPDSGPTWNLRDNNSITWNKKGSIGDIKIELSLLGDFSDTVTLINDLNSGPDGNNSWTWSTGEIPPGSSTYKISDSAKIRISNTTSTTPPAGTALTDTSASAFKIRPELVTSSITSPSLDEEWNVGLTNKTISWSASSATAGTMPQVTIQLDQNGDGTPESTIATVNCTQGVNNYPWTAGVADERTSGAKIKIALVGYSDHDQPSGVIREVTSDPFKIWPQITLDGSITGSTRLIAFSNNPNLVKWSSTGTKFTTVNIRYDVAGANTFTGVIQDGVAVGSGAAGVTWNASSIDVTSDVRIRVYDPNFEGGSPVTASIKDTTLSFQFVGDFTVVSPEGSGTSWSAGDTTKSVTWNFSGTMPTANVYYDLNGGLGANGVDNAWNDAGWDDWTAIPPTNTKAQSGSSGTNITLAWNPLPNPVSNNAMVKITNAAHANPDHPSNVSKTGLGFKIGGTFAVTQPHNGQTVYVASNGVDKDITWTPLSGTGITNVRIEFTNNDSGAPANWTEINPAVVKPNTGLYAGWVPPGTLADLNNDCRIRVSQKSPDNSLAFDEGDGIAFRIKARFTVTEPVGGESWLVGTSHNIKFKKWGAIQKVDFYYTADSTVGSPVYVKVNGSAVDINTLADDTEFTWSWPISATATLTDGQKGKVKVVVNDPSTQSTIEGVQAGNIQVKGSLTLTAPGGTADPGTPDQIVMPVHSGTFNSYYTIRWTKVGNIGNVKLHYSTADSGGVGTYPGDDSTLIATVPATGDVGCVSAPPCYTWPVVDAIGDELRIRVIDSVAANANVFDESNELFRIRGKIRIDVPTNPGVSLRVGDAMTNYIKWTPFATFSNVEIHYSTDGTGSTDATFGTPVPIAPASIVSNSAAGFQGSATWNIPTTFISGNVRIRVRDAAAGNSDVYEISANPFKVLGKIEVTGPEAGGTVWNFGDTTRAIQWDATGPVTNVKISYKTSVGGSYTVLKADQGGFGSGSRSWTWNVWDSGTGIPDEKTETAYVQVLDANFATDMESDASAVSTVPFSIRPVGYFDAPASLARLTATSNYANLIKWHFANSPNTVDSAKVSAVDVEYNCNGAAGCTAGWQPIAMATANSNGVAGVTWNPVPDTVTDNVSLRVLDTTNSNVLTSRTVKIVYDVDLLTPPEAAPNPKVQLKYNQGTVYNIAWTKTGAATGKNVSIRYAKDGVNFNYVIANSVGAASSPYPWNPSLDAVNLYNEISSTGVVRVADTVDPATNAVSAPMSLQSNLDMTAPEPVSDGALTLNVDSSSQYTVRWTTQGITPFVKLQYSTDGGTNWADVQSASNPGASNIANNYGTTPQETTYALTVTDAMRSENFKMRVGDAADLGNGGTDPGNWNPSATSTRVRSKLTLLQPLGAVPASSQALLAGSTYKIRWLLDGTMSTVKLQYSYDGQAFTNIMIPPIPPGTPATGISASAGHANCVDTPPCFNWTVPDTISDDVKVRVVNEQALTPEQYSESPNFFHITGQLVFNPAVPGAGDGTWYVSRPGDLQQKTVTWVETGTIDTVDLQYSTDGTNFFNIPGGTGLSGLSDQFDVFDAIDPTVLVRAVNADATKPTIPAISTDIQVLGKLTITAPATSALLDVDSDYDIIWATAGTLTGTVKIEYSTDSFATAGLAVTGPSGNANALAPGAHNSTNNTFEWTVPNNINNTVKLRITANTANQASAFTTGEFKIRGTLDLLTPDGASLNCSNGGVANQKECYEVEGAMGITWARHGAITNARLQYSTDNFVGSDSSNNFTTTGVNTWDITTVAASNLSYSWDPVDDRISETVKIRIVDAAYNGTTVFTNWDQSPANVAIRGKIDTVTLDAAAITASTVALIDDDVDVAWVKHGTIPDVKVQYRSAVPISASTATQPLQITTGRTHGLSNGNSVVIAGHAVNTCANGTWTVTVLDSTTFTIPADGTSCSAGGVTGSVTGPFVQMLNAALGNADSVSGTTFPWRIPDKKSLNGVTIRITNNSDPDDVVTLTSPAFTIRGGFAWTNPNTIGQVFKVSHAGQPTMPISWNTFGTISNVHIKYSTNNDSTYDPAEPNWTFAKDGFDADANGLVNPSNPATFNWKVPNAISKEVHLAIVDVGDPDAKNVTVKVKIAGTIFQAEPDNNPTQERWGIGTTQRISWTLAGSISGVKLEYTKDGDTTDGTPAITWETPIVDPTSGATGYYDWVNIPGTAVSAKAAIRVSDTDGLSGTDPDISPLFKIVGTFSMTQPAAASVVRTTGTTGALVVPAKDIVWGTSGTIANINLSYSTTGGAPGDCSAGAWTPINTGGPVVNTSPYPWTVPTLFSNTVVVRIRDADDSLTCNDSGAFTVRGDIQLTSPNGGELWQVGQNQNILWNVVGTQGSPNNVLIEFKKGAGGVWSPINDPVSGLPLHNNDGATTWNVPENEVHSQVFLRIYNTVADTDLRYKEVQSAGSFKLVRRYQLSSIHGGGDVHVAGSEIDITWNKWGTVVGDPNGGYGNVYIDLTKTGAAPYSQSVSGGSTANDGIFAWTPTATDVTPTAKIRIADTSDTLFESAETSASNFTIRGVLTLNAIPATVKIGDVYQLRWQRISNVPNVALTYTKTTNFSTDSNFIEDENGNTVANGLVPNNDTACLGLASWGCHKWKVPDLLGAERGTIKVRIQDPNDLYTAYDGSDPKKPQNVSNVFKVIPKFTVTFPAGNTDANLTDRLKVGQTYNITWDSTSSAAAGFTPTVKVMFSTDGGANYFPADVIAGSTANGYPSGSVQWNYNGVDNGGSGVHNRIGVQLKVRVEELGGDLLAADESDFNCKIISNLALNAPGNISGFAIASSTSASPIVVTTSAAHGLADDQSVTIANHLVNTNANGTWYVNVLSATQFELNGSAGNGVGAATGTATRVYTVGEGVTFDWSNVGTVPPGAANVHLMYSTVGNDFTNPLYIPTNNSTPTDIANNSPYDYSWTVPDQIGPNVRLRVKSKIDDGDAVAAFNIRIKGHLSVTQPALGGKLPIGQNFTLLWNTTGTIPNVSIRYSLNGGADGFPHIPSGDPDPDNAPDENVAATNVANSGKFLWKNIPDSPSSNVLVRVQDARGAESDIFGTSPTANIVGNFTVVAANGGESWTVNAPSDIKWRWGGTIPIVKLYYTKVAVNVNDPLATPITGVSATGWKEIDPGVSKNYNAGQPLADGLPANGSVNISSSSNAQITTGANHGLTTGNSVRISNHLVNTDANGTWVVTVLNATQFTLNGYVGSGSGGATGIVEVERKYSWSVPDDISNNVTILVQDLAVPSTVDVSNAVFTIRGSFSLSAPILNDRWVTNELRDISWTTSGTIPFVKIEYSYDTVNFTNPVTLPGAANFANNGNGQVTNFPWSIHDPGMANVPKPVKIRVSDASDPNTKAESASFNIDYYYITWEIRDLLTNQPLSQLTVNEVKSSDPQFVQWTEAGISTNPPRVQPTPFGTWVATWTKAAYQDGVQIVVANQDQSFLMFMETSAIHIWLADSRVSYNPDTKELDILAWLSRDGSITTGAVSAVYKIYDGANQIAGSPLTDNAIDTAGFFNFTLPSPNVLVGGKTYSAICEITVGSGGVFKTPTSFEITTPSKLEEVRDTVNTVLDRPISVVEAGIQSTLTAQTSTIQSALAAQTQLIQSTLTTFQSQIATSIVSLEAAADLSLESAQTLEDTALKFSWKAVVAPNPALTDDMILLQAQGPKHLFPYLSVYNNKNHQVIANGLMTEDISRPGNYSFSFKAAQADFEPGEAYTYIVTEDITGGLVAGSGFIESISLTSVAGLAAAAPAAEKAAKDAVKAIRDLEKSMLKGGDIQDTMKLLRKAVEDISLASQAGPDRETRLMRERILEITETLEELAADQGLSFEELFKKAIDESSSIQDIRGRTGAINQAVELIGAVVEKRLGGVEEPIVDVVLEPAS